MAYGAVEAGGAAPPARAPSRAERPKLLVLTALGLVAFGCAVALRRAAAGGAAPASTSASASSRAAAAALAARAREIELTHTVDDDALAYFESIGCNYEDDDAYFLSDTGCIDGDKYTCDSFLVNNSATDGQAIPYFGANESCAASCASDLDRTWGVPCAWQLIANLPSTCNSTFTPNVTALLHSQNIAPSEESHAQFKVAYDEGTKTATQYDCNLHAFCSACSSANGTVNSYCAATVMYYNSFILDAHVLMYADDFWCRSDVLASIEKGLPTFVADFGIHKHWWNHTNAEKGY